MRLIRLMRHRSDPRHLCGDVRSLILPGVAAFAVVLGLSIIVAGCGCFYSRAADFTVEGSPDCLTVEPPEHTITCCGSCDTPITLTITNHCAAPLTLVRRCRTNSPEPVTFEPRAEPYAFDVPVNESDCCDEDGTFHVDGEIDATQISVSFRLKQSRRR